MRLSPFNLHGIALKLKREDIEELSWQAFHMVSVWDKGIKSSNNIFQALISARCREDQN